MQRPRVPASIRTPGQDCAAAPPEASNHAIPAAVARAVPRAPIMPDLQRDASTSSWWTLCTAERWLGRRFGSIEGGQLQELRKNNAALGRPFIGSALLLGGSVMTSARIIMPAGLALAAL